MTVSYEDPTRGRAVKYSVSTSVTFQVAKGDDSVARVTELLTAGDDAPFVDVRVEWIKGQGAFFVAHHTVNVDETNVVDGQPPVSAVVTAVGVLQKKLQAVGTKVKVVQVFSRLVVHGKTN